jgi:hypothetical protein
MRWFEKIVPLHAYGKTALRLDSGRKGSTFPCGCVRGQPGMVLALQLGDRTGNGNRNGSSLWGAKVP